MHNYVHVHVHVLFSHIYVAVGMVPSPFDCYLANRGLKTLHLRMREHQRNATAVAHLLSTSPHVTETIYPGQLHLTCDSTTPALVMLLSYLTHNSHDNRTPLLEGM